jgi:hypothetical protein
MQQGIYVYGKFLGTTSRDYNFNGHAGVTHSVGIVTSEYQDDFGQPQQTVTKVKINEAQKMTFDNMKDIVGSNVRIKAVFAVREGDRGAYLTIYAPSEAIIEKVSE